MELLLLSLLLLLLLLLLLIYFIKCDDTVAALLNPCQVVLEGILQPGSIPFTAPPFLPPLLPPPRLIMATAGNPNSSSSPFPPPPISHSSIVGIIHSALEDLWQDRFISDVIDSISPSNERRIATRPLSAGQSASKHI